MTTPMEAHLAARGYDLSRYTTSWVTDTRLTVPLFDFGGKLKGYQMYTPDAPKKPASKNPKEAKYFTRMMGHGQLVWGLECEIIGSIEQNNRILN